MMEWPRVTTDSYCHTVREPGVPEPTAFMMTTSFVPARYTIKARPKEVWGGPTSPLPVLGSLVASLVLEEKKSNPGMHRMGS
jgi:hypothetical protein